MSNFKKGMDGNSEIKTSIFSAAQTLFVKKGYHNTSIPDIVKSAGVSTGAIYHYFSGKEELAKFIHKKALEEFFTRFSDKVKTKVTVKEKIHAYVKMMFEWTETDPVMVEYMLYARPKEVLDISVSICAKEGLDAVMEIVELLFREEGCKGKDSLVIGAVISGTITKLIQMRLDGLVDKSLNELTDDTAMAIWGAVE